MKNNESNLITLSHPIPGENEVIPISGILSKEGKGKVIEITKKEWEARKERLGFSAEEEVSESLQREIRHFLEELLEIQMYLELLEKKQEKIPSIIKMFSSYLMRIKNWLILLEQKHQNSEECQILQKLSILFKESIFELKQPAPQNVEEITLNFKRKLLETIKIS